MRRHVRRQYLPVRCGLIPPEHRNLLNRVYRPRSAPEIWSRLSCNLPWGVATSSLLFGRKPFAEVFLGLSIAMPIRDTTLGIHGTASVVSPTLLFRPRN